MATGILGLVNHNGKLGVNSVLIVLEALRKEGGAEVMGLMLMRSLWVVLMAFELADIFVELI